MSFEVNLLHYRALICRFDRIFCYFRSNNDNWFSSDWIHLCINLILCETFERFFFLFRWFLILWTYLMSKFKEAKWNRIYNKSRQTKITNIKVYIIQIINWIYIVCILLIVFNGITFMHDLIFSSCRLPLSVSNWSVTTYCGIT